MQAGVNPALTPLLTLWIHVLLLLFQVSFFLLHFLTDLLKCSESSGTNARLLHLGLMLGFAGPPAGSCSPALTYR